MEINVINVINAIVTAFAVITVIIVDDVVIVISNSLCHHGKHYCYRRCYHKKYCLSFTPSPVPHAYIFISIFCPMLNLGPTGDEDICS